MLSHFWLFLSIRRSFSQSLLAIVLLTFNQRLRTLVLFVTIYFLEFDLLYLNRSRRLVHLFSWLRLIISGRNTILSGRLNNRLLLCFFLDYSFLPSFPSLCRLLLTVWCRLFDLRFLFSFWFFLDQMSTNRCRFIWLFGNLSLSWLLWLFRFAFLWCAAPH